MSRAEHLGPERRRPQVLDAALKLIAEEGVSAVTMAAVATRLGVTRPVVYDCYKGRGELLTALLQREQQVCLAQVLATLPPQRTGTVEQMFIDGFQLLFEAVAQRPQSWQIIVGATGDPALTAAIGVSRSAVLQQVSAVMEPLFKRWDMPDDASRHVLVEVFVAVGEAGVRTMLSGDWAAAGLAEVVGPAAYRALRGSGERSGV